MANMNVDEARAILSAYSDFARQELGQANNDLSRANGVAVFSRTEGRTFTVTRSTDDKIGKFIRSQTLKASNALTRQTFTDAILSLFHKDSISELTPHLRDALAGMTAENSDRPLSARRISVITKEVDLALLEAGDAHVVANAGFDPVAEAGTRIHNSLKNLAYGVVGTSDCLTDVKNTVANLLSAREDDLVEAGGDFIRQQFAELGSLLANAHDITKLKDDLSTFVGDLQTILADRDAQPGTELGTRPSAAAHGFLNLLRGVAEKVEANAFLVDLQKVRENINSLRDTLTTESERLYLQRLDEESSLEKLDAGELDEMTVNRLFMESDPEYVAVLHRQVEDQINEAVEAEKQKIRDSYAAMGEDVAHPILMSEQDVTAAVADSRLAIEKKVWENLAAHGCATITTEDTQAVGSAVQAKQQEFVKGVEDQIEKQITAAVQKEKTRIANEGSDSLKLQLLTPEDEQKFVATMMKEYGSIAWAQVQNGESVRLPSVPIEDAFAAAYSPAVKEKALTYVNELASKFTGELEKLKASVAPRLSQAEKDLTTQADDLAKKKADVQAQLKQLRYENSAWDQQMLFSVTQMGDLLDRQSAVEKKMVALKKQIGSLEGSSKKADQKTKLDLTTMYEKFQGQAAEINKQLNEFAGVKEHVGKQIDVVFARIEEQEKALAQLQDSARLVQAKLEALPGEMDRFAALIDKALGHVADGRSQFVENIALCEMPDVALLEKQLQTFKSDVESSFKLVTDFGETFKDVDSRSLDTVKPPRIYGRYGLHNVEKFSERIVTSAKGYCMRLVQSEIAKLGHEPMTGLENAVAAAFESKDRFPAELLDLARTACANQTNESIAELLILDQVELYVKALVDEVVLHGGELGADGALPEITDAMMSRTAERLANLNPRGEEAVSASAFGNEALVKDAIDVLVKSGRPECQELATNLKTLSALFCKSTRSSELASGAFDETYLKGLTQRLDANLPEGAGRVRTYLALLLKGLVRAQDTSIPKNVETVVKNAREFVRIAQGLTTETEADAFKTISDALPANVTKLLGFDGATTIDKKRLLDAFSTVTGIPTQQLEAMDAERIAFLRPFAEFALEQQQKEVRLGGAFKPFLRSLADDTFPRSLLTENSTAILKDFVLAQAMRERGVSGHAIGMIGNIRGFGTMDAKEILTGLSRDSLLDLPYRAFDGSSRTPSSFEILSFLYSENGERFGGFNELCQQLFETTVDQVTSAQLVLAQGALRKRALGDFSEVGLFKNCTSEQMAGLRTQCTTISNLLSVGIESLMTSTDKKQRPTFAMLTSWYAAATRVTPTTSQSITLAGVPVTLSESKTGALVAHLTLPNTTGPVPIWLSTTPKLFAQGVLESMLRHAVDFGSKERTALAQLLPGAEDPSGRELAMTVIKSACNTDSVKLAGALTSDLVKTAREILTGGIKAGKVDLNQLASSACRNSQSTLDSLARLESVEAAEGAGAVDSIVSINLPAASAKPSSEAARWRNLAADLVSFAQSWTLDRLPGATTGTSDPVAEFTAVRTAHAEDFAALAQMGADERKAALAALGDAELAQALEILAGGTVTETTARQVGNLVKTSVTRQMTALQNEFATSFVGKLGSLAVDDDLMSLRDLAGSDTIDMSKGFGKFLKEFLGDYFERMDPTDKKAMLAAVLRETTADSSSVERLTALVKSAGPIFVKIMQGIPEAAVPADFRQMMGTVKDSMPHIDERIVKAQLLDLVRGSNGLVTGIAVDKSLGAASVGEALLCRIKTRENPDGEECVVKLLRPNVQNYAAREIAFIQSMSDTKKLFLGRLDSILKELDLRMESENVKTSVKYDTLTRFTYYREFKDPKTGKTVTRPGPNLPAMDRVKTMQLHSILPPSVMTLVAKKAPGTTCGKYFAGIEQEIRDIVRPLEVKETVPADAQVFRNTANGQTKSYRVGSFTEYAGVKDRLFRIYLDAKKRQEDLINLSYKWAKGALFPEKGKPGFIHGDLHDGNIMTDKSGMTFIDFGNAIQLSEDERRHIIRAMMFCGSAQTGMFLTELENMQVKIPAEVRKTLTADLDKVLGKGTMNDTGLRFAAAITILQKHNLAIPPTLNSFSQSLLRLQNAVDRANESIRYVCGVMDDLKFDPALLQTQTEIDLKKDPFHNPEIEKLGRPEDYQTVDPDLPYVHTVAQEIQRHAEAFMKEDAKKVLLSFCVDANGAFSPAKIKSELLPFVELRRGQYEISQEEGMLPPEENDRPGTILYNRVTDLMSQSFDLLGDDKESEKLKLENALEQISNALGQTLDCDYANFCTLAVQHEKVSTKLTTFAGIFERCVKDHSEEARSQISVVKDGFKIGASGLKKADAEVAAQDREASEIKKADGYNKQFMALVPNFPQDAVRAVMDALDNRFVFERETFDVSAQKVGNVPPDMINRMYKILKMNVSRLRTTLETRVDYRAEHDQGLWGGRQAVALAMFHWGARNGISTQMAVMTQTQIDQIKAQARNDRTLDAATKDLISEAVDSLVKPLVLDPPSKPKRK